jgi:ATP-dependent DNA helicase RecQ
MKMRLARLGPNAGNHFWGCQAYPECKGTLDIGGVEKRNDETAQDTDLPGQSLPRVFQAEGITPAHRAVYLDTVTLQRWLVKSLARSTEAPFAGYSWRIDLPNTEPDLPDYHPGVDPSYAFLLRGGLTSASRAIAESVGLHSEPDRDEVEAIRDGIPAYLFAGTPLDCSDRVFGSVEERMIYHALANEIRSDGLAVSVVPQVGFQTLTPGSDLADAGFSVDFAIANSTGNRFVLEIDGAQHANERSNDERRDAALAVEGFSVIRVSAAAVRADPAGEARQALRTIGADRWAVTDDRIRHLQQLSQLQIAIVAAMRAGLIASVGRVAINVGFATTTLAPTDEAINVAIADLSELIRDTALARGSNCPELNIMREDSAGATRIVFGSVADDLEPATIYIHDNIQIAPPLIELGAADTPSGDPIDRGAACRLFERCYGFADFRPGQFEAIERAIRGLDTLLLLPTGAGKSATYQFATLIRGGVCVVVDPLLSLIDDQIQNLREHGVDRSAQVSSQIETKQRDALVTLLCQGHISFIFVSPERLQQVSFREAIQVVALRRGVAMIAIDEAHCVSQWGHDFRPAYLNVARTIRGHSRRATGVTPPVIAMTGTASYAVLRDIQRELEISDPKAQITPNDFDRKELRFEVIPCASRDKGAELDKVLVGLHKRFRVRDAQSFWSRRRESPITGLVFCPHVNGTHGTVDVANRVRRAVPNLAVATHSGKAPKGTGEKQWSQLKRAAAAQFKRDELQVLACTNSFGMGIDKPNIRFTLHWGMPQSIESFYQEAGRAGRGRSESWCILLASDDNPALSERQLAGRGPFDEPPWASQSDIDRQLWFHRSSFPNEQQELDLLNLFVTEILAKPEGVVEISFAGDTDKQSRERAVYRLLLIGVADDYTIDWRKGVFEVHARARDSATIIDRLSKYVRAFNAKRGNALQMEMETWCREKNATALETAGHASKLLVEFTYDQIEGTRRRALSEMRRVAFEHAGNEEKFRHALLAYLSTSAFSSMLQAVADDQNGGLELIAEIITRVESPLDAADLSTQAARLLGSIFDHPGLLVIHAAALLASTHPDANSAAEDLTLAFISAGKFDLEPRAILAALDLALDALEVSDSLRDDVANRLTTNEENPDYARSNAELLAYSQSPAIAGRGLSFLMTGVLTDTDRLLETLKHVV